LAFEFFKESYTGSIKQITLGKGDKAVTVGGEACYPFYQFEGAMPNKPKIAMEIWDMEPDEWPEAALSPFKDVKSQGYRCGSHGLRSYRHRIFTDRC
jgi:acetyl-CoA decarbonylase/synthase complex subunit delta